MTSRATARAGRLLTPLRISVAVTAVAAIALIASQFMDYSGIAIGSNDYAVYPGLESVAPAPQVELASAGSAHAYLLVPVGLVAILALGLALAGRARLGWLVAGLGLVGLAIVLVVDLPAGLDEGTARLSYDGADAGLLSAFWIELVASAVLVVGGALVARHGRGATE